MLVSIDDVKKFLKLTVTDDDDMLFEILRAAYAEAENYIGYPIDSATYTDQKYDGTGTDTLYLIHRPLISVTHLYIDIDRSFAADTEVLAADMILYDDRIVLDGIIFDSAPQSVKITYVAGYSAATIPADLVQAVVNLAAAAYIESKGGINAIEGESVTYKPYNLRRNGRILLDAYKRWDL